jgi:hypothetical protein
MTSVRNCLFKILHNGGHFRNELSKSNGIVKGPVDIIGSKAYLTLEFVNMFLKRYTSMDSNFANAAHTHSGCSKRRNAKSKR